MAKEIVEVVTHHGVNSTSYISDIPVILYLALFNTLFNVFDFTE